MMNIGRLINIVVFLSVAVSGSAPGQERQRFEAAPIFYHSRPLTNSVSALNALSNTPLVYEPEQGYLKSVLKALDISPESQILVFNSSSFQEHLIGGDTPRALYFNDTTYVGWIPEAELIEIISMDPFIGPVFYDVKQDPALAPQINRNTRNCLNCHSSARTQNVPGLLVSSTYARANGRFNTFSVFHQTPLEDRWGGWYVTGRHGSAIHHGNLPKVKELPSEKSLNVTDLSPFFDVGLYLTPHSDLMALMVFDHQCHMQNLITRANYRIRSLLHGHAPDPAGSTAALSESLQKEVDRQASILTRHLLYTNEAKLDAPISGTSNFTVFFAAQGTKDEQGRSLREFDGTERLFKYSCSYLIYSPGFHMLPAVVKNTVYQRMHTVLCTAELDEEFPHLAEDDKLAIYEILKSTLPDLPENW